MVAHLKGELGWTAQRSSSTGLSDNQCKLIDECLQLLAAMAT